MLNCNTCVIGITFILSSIYLTILRQDKSIFTNFTNLLDDEQLVKYETIVKERLMIYITAMITGILTGILYYYRNPKQPYIICTVIAIVYLVKLGVYYFYPKSPLMLYSLKTTEQTDAWAQIYEEMKGRYKISLLVGFIGYLVLFSGLK